MSEASSRPLRIAAFSAVDLSLPQGHALHLRGLFDALAARGHDLVLITPRPKGVGPSTLFRLIEIPILRWRVLGPWSFEILGSLRLLFLCKGRKSDLIYVRHDLYTALPAIVAKLLKIPMIVEVNSSITEELAISGRSSARTLVAWCERFTLRRATSLLVLAEEHGRSVAQRTGVDPARISTVPIGTRIPSTSDPHATRESLCVDTDRFIVCFAGNLSPIQGVDLLLHAAGEIDRPGIDFWIVGTGSEEERLRRIAGALGSRVRFFGGLPLDLSEPLMQASQLLVAPYRKNEYQRVSGGGALSSKVLAYLASDRPVLMTDLESYSWLEEIGAGNLADTSDPSVLAKSIMEWDERWRAAGKPLTGWPWNRPGPGRRFVEEGRTWDSAAAQVDSIVSEVVGRTES